MIRLLSGVGTIGAVGVRDGGGVVVVVVLVVVVVVGMAMGGVGEDCSKTLRIDWRRCSQPSFHSLGCVWVLPWWYTQKWVCRVGKARRVEHHGHGTWNSNGSIRGRVDILFGSLRKHQEEEKKFVFSESVECVGGAKIIFYLFARFLLGQM